MQTIIYIKNYKDKGVGMVENVSNNIAHGLVEIGVAKIYSDYNLEKISSDKMMRTGEKIKRNKYFTKGH
jgi:hypothetical protein